MKPESAGAPSMLCAPRQPDEGDPLGRASSRAWGFWGRTSASRGAEQPYALPRPHRRRGARWLRIRQLPGAVELPKPWAAARPLLPDPPRRRPPSRAALTLPGKGPGRSSFSACLFSSTRRALQFSHQTPRSEPGEEPPPLPEPGEPVPKPGEPPREPGELVPMPGEAGPGEPVKELGDEVPEPGDGVPDEPSAEPAPSGVGRLPVRDSS